MEIKKIMSLFFATTLLVSNAPIAYKNLKTDETPNHQLMYELH